MKRSRTDHEQDDLPSRKKQKLDLKIKLLKLKIKLHVFDSQQKPCRKALSKLSKEITKLVKEIKLEKFESLYEIIRTDRQVIFKLNDPFEVLHHFTLNYEDGGFHTTLEYNNGLKIYGNMNPSKQGLYKLTNGYGNLCNYWSKNYFGLFITGRFIKRVSEKQEHTLKRLHDTFSEYVEVIREKYFYI